MNKKFSLFAAICLIAASQVIAEDPRIKQGAIFESQGKYDMALGEYRSMLAENPNNSDAYLAAAKVRVKMKDYSGALANFRLAYKFSPNMSAAYEGAAKVYEQLGDKKKAAEERAKDPNNKPVETAPATEPAAAPAAPAEPVKAAEAPKAAESPKKADAIPAPAIVPPKTAEAPKAETPKVEPPKPAEPQKAAEAPKAVETPKAAEAPKPAEKQAEVKPAAPAEPVKAAEAPKAPEKPVNALPEDPFEKGKALFAAGKYSEAAPLWREVLKKTPGHAGAYFYAGLTRYELGEFDKAEFNLKKGLDYKEEGNDANYYLACIYQKNNKADLEKKFLGNYLKKAAPNGKFRRKAEDRLAMLTAAAAKEAEKLSSEAKAAESSDSKSVAKVDTVKPQAGAPADPAVAAGPSVENAISMMRAGNLDGALQMYKTLLETEQSPEVRPFILLQMGNIYREKRGFDSAVERYREVVQQFPDSEWATEAERAQQDAIWLQQQRGSLPR